MSRNPRAVISGALALVAEYLAPYAAERDEAFRLEVQRLSRRSLNVMAAILLGVVVFGYPVIALLPPIVPVGINEVAVACIVGITVVSAMFAFARSAWGLQYGRLGALMALYLTTVGAVVFDLSVSSSPMDAERFIMADCTGSLLVAVALIPALPVHMLALGLGIATTVVVAFHHSEWNGVAGAESSLVWLVVALAMGAVLCALLSGVSYQRLWKGHRSHQEVLRVQRGLLLSENAASLGKLAAALSHELNSPLGSVKSSAATLESVRKKLRDATPEQRERLESMAASLEDNIARGLTRMEHLVRNMQRFTNLDRAEEREFDLDRMIEDVVALIEPDDRERAGLVLDLGRAPRVYSRPQQVSAVLSRLVQESIEAVPAQACIRVATRVKDSTACITISDNRPPLTASDLKRVFEPDFRVHRGRIAAGNWSWFHSREMLRELGGDLAISSSPEATVTTISLPAATSPEA